MNTDPKESAVSTRGPTYPRSEDAATKSARDRILAAGKDGDEFSPIKQDTTLSSDDENETDKRDGQTDDIKIIPFQGKSRSNIWFETVKSSIPLKVDKVFEDAVINGHIDPDYFIKYKNFDIKLHAALIKSLVDKKAEPENDALALFNKLMSHKHTIARSGMRTLIIIQDAI